MEDNPPSHAPPPLTKKNQNNNNGTLNNQNQTIIVALIRVKLFVKIVLLVVCYLMWTLYCQTLDEGHFGNLEHFHF
jgi:hypothetical protein